MSVLEIGKMLLSPKPTKTKKPKKQKKPARDTGRQTPADPDWGAGAKVER